MSERSFLEEISIRNLGIIDQSELELGPGLNVLTGETGAGKTMILTALSLVLGGKSDSALVRHGSDRLVASATFSVPKVLHSDLEEVGAVIEDVSKIRLSTNSNWMDMLGAIFQPAPPVMMHRGSCPVCSRRCWTMRSQAPAMA